MSDFNPDAFLSETKPAQPDSGFNPDSFLQQTEPAAPSAWDKVKAFGKGALNVLDRVSHFGQPQAAKDLAQRIATDPKDAPINPEQVSQKPTWWEAMGSMAPGQTMPTMPPGMDIRPAVSSVVDAATSPMSYIGELPAVAAKAAKLAGLAAKMPVKTAAMAVDAARGGTEAGDVLKGVGQGVDAYKARTAAKIDEVMNPKLAPDADKYQQIGKALGFTDDELKHPAIEYGQNSVQARRNKVLAQGEGGAPYLQQHNAMTEKIQNGFDNAIHAISGPPLEPTQAGELIRQGVMNGAKRIASTVSTSHNDIIDQFPGLTINGDEAAGINSKLAGIERFAKGRAMRGIDPEQRAAAQTLLDAVDAARSTNGSYKQLNEAREMIGDVAFDNVGAVGKVPAYQQKLREMYFAINDGLIGTVGKLDRVRANQFRKAGAAPYEPIRDQLIESNKILHDMFQDEASVGRALGNAQKAPENVFNEALLYGGDSRKVQALKNLLTPEEFEKVKGSYLNALIKKGKEDFTYKSAKNALAQKRSVIDPMFADNPQQIEGVKSIVDLGDRVGAPLLPGSAGQLEFGGVNSLGKLIHKAMEPVGDITAEIGKVRAHAGPRAARDISAAKMLPPYLVAALGMDSNLPQMTDNQDSIPIPALRAAFAKGGR